MRMPPFLMPLTFQQGGGKGSDSQNTFLFFPPPPARVSGSFWDVGRGGFWGVLHHLALPAETDLPFAI